MIPITVSMHNGNDYNNQICDTNVDNDWEDTQKISDETKRQYINTPIFDKQIIPKIIKD
jgi:ribosomal protein S19